jgi:hypothetical protein
MAGVHPYSLRNVLQNPLARMLPLHDNQSLVYKLGEKHPPSGGMIGHSPTWEAVSFIIAARGTAQVRVSLQRNFTLLALSTSASSVANGGFRAQLYDTKKKRRLADRGVQQANIAGSEVAASGPFFLREPYQFDQPDSQLLVIVQNLETVTNTIQIALYGQVLRFNELHPGHRDFPGGLVPTIGR